MTLSTKTPAELGFPEGATAEMITFPEREGYLPREAWPQGPWNGEPDKIHWVDPTTKLDCLIVRNRLGALCGYVGVPAAHPWHGIDYRGCLNKHNPKTMEEKRTRALERLEDAQEAFEKEPTKRNQSSLDLMALAAKPWLEGDPSTSRWCTMDEWDCTIDGDCSTPERHINVHGGLTYSNACNGGHICHRHEDGDKNLVWWFGFDCGHYQDLAPGMLAVSKMMREKGVGKGKGAGGKDLFTEDLEYDPETGVSHHYGMAESYKTVAYVKEQVQLLAQQLGEVTITCSE